MTIGGRSNDSPLGAALIKRERLLSVVLFKPSRSARRWGRAGGHQASLASTLGSLVTIVDRRKLSRALFELIHAFALSLPKAAVRQASRFVLLLILRHKTEAEDDRGMMEKRHEIDVMPRPEPPLTRLQKALPNAPNRI